MAMWGMDSVCKRNGYGMQEWPDGSKYEGEYINNLKHDTGVFTWPNGEFYKGSFFRDCRHGNGMYSWPDGSKFTGKFYLNRKEGYGVHIFPDGSTFQGLYHADQRFGPGVMTYPDGRQDVGLWHRQRLLRLCTTLEGGFTLKDFPEHMARLPKKQLPVPSQLLTMDDDTGSALDHAPSEVEDRFIRPPDIERYTTDSDHLPIPRHLRQDLDLHFFGRSDISTEEHLQTTDDVPLQQRMNRHIQRHKFEIDALDWEVTAVLNMNRDQFGPKGPLELNSERLIKEASLGERVNVHKILRNGHVHPDVSDAQGHTALIAATVNFHNDIIHLLLDIGADVNKVNDEGMSALAVCNVFYYPHQGLHETLAEKTPQNLNAELQIKHQTSPEYISDECSSDPVTATSKDQSSDDQHTIQSVELEKPGTPEGTEENISENEIVPQSERLNSEEPQSHEQTNELQETTEDENVLYPESLKTSEEPEAEMVPQPECEQDRPTLEPNVSKFSEINETECIQVFDDKIPVGSVSWRVRKADDESDEDYERSIRSDDSPFDSARSVASFPIDVTEENLQKSAEMLCEMGTVTPADSQETVCKIAHLKKELVHFFYKDLSI